MRQKVLMVLTVIALMMGMMTGSASGSGSTAPNYTGASNQDGDPNKCPTALWASIHDHDGVADPWMNDNKVEVYGFINGGGTGCTNGGYSWLNSDLAAALYKTSSWPPNPVLCWYVGGQGFVADDRLILWENNYILDSYSCNQNPVVVAASYTVAMGYMNTEWASHAGGTAWVEMCTC